jgi:hypothetical protein
MSSSEKMHASRAVGREVGWGGGDGVGKRDRERERERERWGWRDERGTRLEGSPLRMTSGGGAEP